MELEIELIQSKWINIDQISPNEGQIDDVPCNPRTITPAEYESLKQSILDFPKMLALKELYVKQFEDGYVVVDGNMRLKAMNELGITKAPCKIIPSDYTPEEIMQLIITANLPYGDWDTSRLQEDAWNQSKLADWFGEKMPEFDLPSDGLDDGIALSDSGNAGTITLQLKFGSKKIVITEEELSGLEEILAEYTNENSTSIGFGFEIVERWKKSK